MAVKWERDRVTGVYWRIGARGRKLFRHVYRDTEGKQVACSKHETVTAARRHQQEMQVHKRPPAVRLSLRQAYDQLVADAEYADATLKVHMAAWKYIEHLAGVQVGKITPTQVSNALKAVPGSEMRTKVRYLLSVLGAPVPVERNPRTRAKRMQRERKPLRTITAEELARLVSEMPERYRALVELMAYQGLRPGEAVSLRVGDLDPLRRTLTIERSISGFTKTGEPRTLTLPPPIVEVLTDHIARYSDRSDPDAPMFGPIASKNSYDAWSRRHFTPAVERAGIDRKLSPNDLRHYAVKFAIGRGATVFAVQNMLGHSKPSITLDVYGSMWETSAEDLAAALEEPIRQARATQPTEAEIVQM